MLTKDFIFSGTILDTNPQNFLYVELNSILQSNCVILSKYFKILNKPHKYEYYKGLAINFQTGIDNVSTYSYIINILFYFNIYIDLFCYNLQSLYAVL